MAAAAQARRISTTEAAGSSEPRRRILYAEDQVSSRVVTKAMLEKMGFEVEAVDDGEVAVEKAATGSYDFILLDIEMPVMDGVTAARIIRAENKSQKFTPILALSAFLADSTENCHWRDAFDTAVAKPANMQDIHLALQRAKAKHENKASEVELAATASPDESLWQCMERGLPRASRVLLARTAASEMEHLTLALAAARDAGEVEQLRKCRHTLKGLALNFGLNHVVEQIKATSNEPRALDVTALIATIRSWRDAY